MTTPAPAIDAGLAPSSDFHRQVHPHCHVCGASPPLGLGVGFHPDPSGGVAASWICPPHLVGYPDTVHGGIVATLLDGAMAQALFTRRITAYTADLHVRYHHPVRPGRELDLRADLTSSRRPLYVLTARIIQDGRLCARATARFLEPPRPSPAVAPLTSL